MGGVCLLNGKIHLLVLSKASHLMFFSDAHAINGEKHGIAWMYYTTQLLYFYASTLSSANYHNHNNMLYKTTD